MKRTLFIKLMLLLCALVVGTSSVWADTEVTFTPGTDTGATSVTKNGVTCTMYSMDNNSYYQIYANASGTFSISAGNIIKKIEFTCTASGTKKYGPGNASAKVGEYSYSGTIGTWTGSASSVTISTTKEIRMSSLTVTYASSSGGSSDPSISANDVNIAYNATSGSIKYSIGGTGNVEASVTTGDWLTLGTITASEVPFTCSTNTGNTARTATVTLSFTGVDDKVVTVTQAAAPTIALNAACTDGEKYYGTYSSSKAFVVPSGLTVSEIKLVEGKLSITNYNTGAIVPANTGVMVSSTTSGNHPITLSDEAGTSVLGANNMLKASGDAGITAEAMAAAASGCKYYRLTMHNAASNPPGEIGFWWGAESGAAFALSAHKAYLAVPTGSGDAPSLLWFDNGSTGIDEVRGKMEEVRGDYFDLQGRKVANPTKGLYIVDGKKVVVK